MRKMEESERLDRYRKECTLEWCDENDAELAKRIKHLLNHPQIDQYCMVDAYYYDFSVIPVCIQEDNNFYRDMYLLFGITTKGEVVTKWVERYDLDSTDPIVNGEVVRGDKPTNPIISDDIPEINVCFNPKLLLVPTPNFAKMFGKTDD